MFIGLISISVNDVTYSLNCVTSWFQKTFTFAQ